MLAGLQGRTIGPLPAITAILVALSVLCAFTVTLSPPASELFSLVPAK